MLKITYQKYNFHLKLEKEVRFGVHPLFLLRSIMGNELKKMCCIFARENKPCLNCQINQTCAYSSIFETVLNTTDNKKIHTSHPFILYSSQEPGEMYSYIDFDLTLLGNAVNYFPYLFQAFNLGGNNGIFKDRIKYKIESLTCDEVNIYKNGSLNLPHTTKSWEFFSKNGIAADKKCKIRFLTPFKYLPDNKFVKSFSYSAVLNSALRRQKILASFFGENSMERDLDLSVLPKSESNNSVWQDYTRFSARQQSEMQMGGFMGVMSVDGDFSLDELQILAGAELFNIGKSVSFGLGKIAID